MVELGSMSPQVPTDRTVSQDVASAHCGDKDHLKLTLKLKALQEMELCEACYARVVSQVEFTTKSLKMSMGWE